MTTTTQIQKALDGLSAIHTLTVNQTTGLVRQRTFAELTAIITAERSNITSNGPGQQVSTDGEMVYVYGEVGHRLITIGTTASTTHGRTVVLDSANRFTLDSDSNTCTPTSSVPTVPITSANVGNVMVNTTAKIVYKAVTIGAAWVVFLSYASSSSISLPFTTSIPFSGSFYVPGLIVLSANTIFTPDNTLAIPLGGGALDLQLGPFTVTISGIVPVSSTVSTFVGGTVVNSLVFNRTPSGLNTYAVTQPG